VNEDWLMEIRRQTDEAMQRAKGVIEEAYREFRAVFGRGGDPFLEEYLTEDAEMVLVGMGTLAMPVKVAIRRLREEGQRVGFVRLKWLRPFPTEELRRSLGRFRAVGVIDRDYSYGSPSNGGVLFNEVRSALYPLERRPLVLDFISGLGGREVRVPDVHEMVGILGRVAETGRVEQETHWIGVRG
jgi:pyruvate ferredoxin oxidoreductase alpha subunit